MRRLVLLVAFLIYTSAFLPAALSAQEATPPLADLPEATAPFGLGTVILPPDEGNIAGLFALLPTEVAGQARAPAMTQEPGRIRAVWGEDEPAYGPPLVLQAFDFSGGDFFPQDFTAEIFVASVAQVEDYGAVAYGREGDLVWVQAESTIGIASTEPGTPEASRPLYTLAWGQANAHWLFVASASTPAGLEAIVTAFVRTAGGPPATPVATPA